MSSTLRRLRHTPLLDLIRLRITARLDWKQRIATSDLPHAIQSLLQRVITRTGLWPSERAELASELAAHFADGLQAGTSAPDLIRDFGDEQFAARLLRRGKIRNRPLLWHAWKWMFRGAAALFSVYLILAAYFFTGQPSINVNYIQQLDLPVLNAPPADRAWPLYRQGLLLVHDSKGHWPDFIGEHYTPARRLRMDRWIAQHQSAIDLFRQASKKPVFGFLVGKDGSWHDETLWPERSVGREWDVSLISIQLPYLNECRAIAMTLALDAKIAANAGDSERARVDIEAIFELAAQVKDAHKELINSLVGVGCRSVGIDALAELLTQKPSIFSDATWRDFAHALSRVRSASDLLRLEEEREFFHDVLQRCYTDDGHGDGRLTVAGIRYLADISAVTGNQTPTTEATAAVLLAPAMLPVLASRRELLDLNDRMFDRTAANYGLPLRDVTATSSRWLMESRESTWDQIRYGMVLAILPSLDRPQASAERLLGMQEGLETAIALELFKRHTGSYPATLGDLVPGLLPAIPADRITGEPIRYRLIDGKPLIYSVGFDRIDDGGRLADPNNPIAAAYWPSPGEKAPDLKKHAGDWVLYPVPHSPE
jgi:hypothetical protein